MCSSDLDRHRRGAQHHRRPGRGGLQLPGRELPHPGAPHRRQRRVRPLRPGRRAAQAVRPLGGAHRRGRARHGKIRLLEQSFIEKLKKEASSHGMKPLFCCGAAKGDSAFQGRNTAAAAGCARGKIARRGGNVLSGRHIALCLDRGTTARRSRVKEGTRRTRNVKETGLKDAAKSIFYPLTLEARRLLWDLFVWGGPADREREAFAALL